MENNMQPNELYHWGIKGMRWGVRRFQNSDGSLTSEGRKRYDADDPVKKSIRERVAEKRAAKKAAALKKKRVEAMKRGREEKKKQEEEARKTAEKRAKDLKEGKISFKDMTDEELAANTARLRAEKQYKDAVKDVDPGRRIASKMVNEMLVPGIVNGGKDLTAALLKHYGSEWLGLNEKDAHTLLREREEESRWKRNIQENNEWLANRKENIAREKQKQAEIDEAARLKRESENAKNRKTIYDNRNYYEKGTKLFSDSEKAAIKDAEDKIREQRAEQQRQKEAQKQAQQQSKDNKQKDSTKNSSDKQNKESSSNKQESKKETSKSTSEKLKETTSWFNNMDWDIKAHTPSKKTGRNADLYDQHLSRNEEEFLKKFMK